MKRRRTKAPAVRVREAPPRVKESAGGVLVMCPFCRIPHPIAVGKPSACGTELRVTAVQTVIPERTVRAHKLACIKCGGKEGEMVPFNQGYVHLYECTPGTQLLAEPPKNFSRLARLIYGLHPWVRSRIEKRTGAVKRIDEIDAGGHETGRTLGYIFYKGA